MMLLINISYEKVTEESAEYGDIAESGEVATDKPFTFRELVDAISNGECSAWPAKGDVWEWVDVPQGETRAFFERGERETHHYHFSASNPGRKEKYWRKAFRAAGILKGGK